MNHDGSAPTQDARPVDPAFRLLRTLAGHSDVIHRIAWSPDLRTIATPSRDQTVRVWDFMTGKCLTVLDRHDSWVNTVAWSPDGNRLATGTERGVLSIWRLTDWSLERVIPAHRTRIECVAWDATGEALASASADGTVGIWDPNTGIEIRRLDDHRAWVNAVAWSPDGRFLASGGEDPSVKVWDARDLRLQNTLTGHRGWVTDVVWSPDSSVLASASGREIRLWDPTDGRLRDVLTGHEDRVKVLTFSGDGRLLASKGNDHTVRVWRCDRWQLVLTLEEPTRVEINPENSIAFHPSLPVLATLGDYDTVVRIWSVDSDRLLGAAPAEPEVRYRNAKVVLVGASSSGKSCLARACWAFHSQESTHGMKVWPLHTQSATHSGAAGVPGGFLVGFGRPDGLPIGPPVVPRQDLGRTRPVRSVRAGGDHTCGPTLGRRFGDRRGKIAHDCWSRGASIVGWGR